MKLLFPFIIFEHGNMKAFVRNFISLKFISLFFLSCMHRKSFIFRDVKFQVSLCLNKSFHMQIKFIHKKNLKMLKKKIKQKTYL